MDILGGLGDLWSWLTTPSGSTNPGGSAGGTPYLGAASPTASTQAPILGGATAIAGAGLLGGQQPVNPMSLFQPYQTTFGQTPLGGMIRGGLEGLGSAAGYGGLTGVGVAAMGTGQAEQQRRQNQMEAVLAGQKYQGGQQQLVQDAIKNQQLVQQINSARRIWGLPDVTLNDILANPNLISSPTSGQAGLSPAATSATATQSPATTANPPIVPTAQITNPNVTAAYGGLGSGGTTDPSRGSSWGGGVTDPTMGAPAPVVAQPLAGLGSGGVTDPSRGSSWGGGATDPAMTALVTPPPPSVVSGTAGTRAALTAAGQQQKAAGPVGAIGGASATTQQPPAQQSAAQPQQTTAAQPSQAGGGTFSMPMTIQDLENSNLPDWAKRQLYPAYLSAGTTGDLSQIYQAWDKVNEVLMAPQRKAAEVTAAGAATAQLPETAWTQASDLQSKYQADPAVQSKQRVDPIYQAGLNAYNANYNDRQAGKEPTSSVADQDLVNSALQMMADKSTALKPGSAEAMAEARGIGDWIAKAKSEIMGGKGLSKDTADALKAVIERHYQAAQDQYNVSLGNFRQQAKFRLGGFFKDGNVPDSIWNPDTPPPPPPDPSTMIRKMPDGSLTKPGGFRWNGSTYDVSSWTPA